jgi:hypothetical protein
MLKTLITINPKVWDGKYMVVVIGNSQKGFIEKSQGKMSLRRPRHRWIEIIFQNQSVNAWTALDLLRVE